MSKITDITPQIKDKERCNIFIDGVFYCGLKLESAIKYKLKVDGFIEKSELDKIQFENEKSEALDKAMTHLSVSPKTEKQICDYLKKKGYVESICEYVIEKLRGYNFVNDGEYAKTYIDFSKNKGKRLIELELKKRGVDDDNIENALNNLSEEKQIESAVNVLTKYLRYKDADKQTLYKAFKYLMSKGFEYETAKKALEKWGDIDEDL